MIATPLRGFALRVLGSGLLLTTGAIHLDLYLTGYRHIATIGTLFLLQVVTAFVLALIILLVPRGLVALAGAGFALSTLGGYILSLWVGLFGFNEIRTTAGVVAGVAELATFVVLVGYAIFGASDTAESSIALHQSGRRAAGIVGLLAVVAFVLAVACSPGATMGTTTTSASAGSATTRLIRVSIKNYEFMPATFTVAPGAKIIVTNHDSVTHTFTALPGTSPQGTFSSGNIAPGETVTVIAPDKLGSYKYYCDIHNYMVGSFTVR